MVYAYLFILLALFAGATKGWCGKKTSFLMKEPADAAAFNALRMLLCIPIGFVFLLIEHSVPGLLLTPGALGLSAFSGACNAMFVVVWLFAVRHNAYMTVEISLMMGCLIPTFGTALLFSEPIHAAQIIGFILLTAAVVLINGYNRQISGKKTAGDIVLLVLSGTAEGLCGLSQQFYKHWVLPVCPSCTSAVFSFYTYVFAFLCLLLVLAGFRVAGKRRGVEGVSAETASAAGASTADTSAADTSAADTSTTDTSATGALAGSSAADTSAKGGTVRGFLQKVRPAAGYIAVMALCLFCHSYFQTLATAVFGMSSQVMYPLLKGGSLVFSTAMAALFFGEKLTKRSLFGIVTAFGGLLFINVFHF